MEIRVEERMTGRRLRDRILLQYGSRKQLERLARRPEEKQARDDLFMLRLFEEDPKRLDLETYTTTVTDLAPEDIQRLTPERIRLLNLVATKPGPSSLTQISQTLGRDKKNISEDLRTLEALGLITLTRKGRETIPRLLGSEIHIVVADSAA